MDLRFALRQLARAPGFTVVAALTLAVGIGANTALFSLATAVLARPLPEIGQPDGLVWITPTSARSARALNMSYPDFRDYQSAPGLFAGAAATSRAQFSISSSGEPIRVRGELVSGDYFSLLRVRMERGRGLTPEDDRTATDHPAVVISHRLWRERFDSSANVIGSRATIDGREFTVVGVVPERFNGAEHSERLDVWVPLSLAETALPGFDGFLTNRNAWWLTTIARLAPGVSVERANAVVATIAQRIQKTDSAGHAGVTALVSPVRSGLSPGQGNDIYAVATLAGAVTLLVLLIACANVSNLLLGRAVARRREIAVRLSIGASRARIVRQLLTESLLLAAIGSVLGALIASWGTSVMASLIPAPVDVSFDSRVLAFTIAAAVLTGVGFGVVPALHATRADVATALKDATVGVDRARAKLQTGFVVAQVSLSLVLLVTAGLFLGALYKSSRVDVHFDATDNVLAASFDLGLQGYTAERAASFLDQLRARAAALPGVEEVSFTNQVPMGDREIGASVVLEGETSSSAAFGERNGHEVSLSTIRPRYFRTIGIPLARGRDFAAADRPGAEPVAIVSEEFARLAWPKTDPIGKRLSFGGPRDQFMTVVGVVRDAQTTGRMDRRWPAVYVPQMQRPSTLDLTMLVRRSRNAAELGPALRGLVRDLDRDLPVFGVQTLLQYRYERGAESRLGSMLLAIFGTLALLLATVGVYAVMAFSVGQRIREIGVRVALGAAGGTIATMFVRQALRLAAVGLTVGTVLSLGVAKLLSATFLGLSMTDAVPFAAGGALLAAAVVVASWIPARRAARVDPMIALRAE